MDPRTTYPFWDYDFAPLYSKEWITKMIAATSHHAREHLNRDECLRLFGGPSVPRKELICSLVDMKVAECAIDERMRLVEYWVNILKIFCGDDWLSDGSNRIGTSEDLPESFAVPEWFVGGRATGRALGALSSALHALAYGLYSDVFVHQCAEAVGAYDVSSMFGGHRHSLIFRCWSGLCPTALWPGLSSPGFERLTIAAIYEDVEIAIDVYNHVAWLGHLSNRLRQYCICIDGEARRLDDEQILRLAYAIAYRADLQHRSYKSLGFEAHGVMDSAEELSVSQLLCTSRFELGGPRNGVESTWTSLAN
jgi:hypothetical protein